MAVQNASFYKGGFSIAADFLQFIIDEGQRHGYRFVENPESEGSDWYDFHLFNLVTNNAAHLSHDWKHYSEEEFDSDIGSLKNIGIIVEPKEGDKSRRWHANVAIPQVGSATGSRVYDPKYWTYQGEIMLFPNQPLSFSAFGQ